MTTKSNRIINKESPQRSILKAISWRIIATSATMLIIYQVSGSLDWALIGGVFDIILKLVLYYLHERLWINIKWGKVWKQRAWRRKYNKMRAIRDKNKSGHEE